MNTPPYADHISVRELWAALRPTQGRSAKEWFLVLTGYIDESYSGEKPPETFALSCLLARFTEWMWIENAWLDVIDKKNTELQKAGRKPIKRFHAVDLNNYREDFEDWGEEERKEFKSQLCRKVFNRHDIFHVCWTVNLKLAVEVWPEYAEQPLVFAYEALLLHLMEEIGWVARNELRLSEHERNISLIHERCSYDGVLLDTFNKALAHPDFPDKSMFTTIAPMPWELCVPLQPADFAAYEAMKEAHRFEEWDHGKPLRNRRKSFEAMWASPSFGVDIKELSRKDLEEARARMENKVYRIWR
jgi:hypothetical protein